MDIAERIHAQARRIAANGFTAKRQVRSTCTCGASHPVTGRPRNNAAVVAEIQQQASLERWAKQIGEQVARDLRTQANEEPMTPSQGELAMLDRPSTLGRFLATQHADRRTPSMLSADELMRRQADDAERARQAAHSPYLHAEADVVPISVNEEQQLRRMVPGSTLDHYRNLNGGRR